MIVAEQQAIVGRVDVHYRTRAGAGQITCVASIADARHFAAGVDDADGADTPRGGRRWRFEPCEHEVRP